MLNIKRILLPIDIPIDVPINCLDLIHQAAILARHFNSEIIVLHVVGAQSHAAGVPKDSRAWASWDLLAEIMREAKNQGDSSIGPALEGLSIRRELAEGEAAEVIVHRAEEENVDLIMMPSYSRTFYEFLMGSVTAKVLHGTERPVWTGAHVQGSQEQKFALHNVLAAVEFGPRADVTVSWAAQMAAEFGARLTLAYVTASVEFWGPGGGYVNEKLKDELVGDATAQMSKLLQDTGVKADVFIGSGDVPKVLSQAAKQTSADLLVTGCYPYGGHLRTHGYGIICAVPIPVLNV
jgi:nucleotide-binding universal stress UspA family protein